MVLRTFSRAYYAYAALALFAILDFAFSNAATLMGGLASSAAALGISMQEQAARLTALALFDVLAFVGCALSAAAMSRGDYAKLRIYAFIAFLAFAGSGIFQIFNGDSLSGAIFLLFAVAALAAMARKQ